MKFTVVKKTDSEIKAAMAIHYSQPRGFVGRSICYAIEHDEIKYGFICGGSATKFLPNRNTFFGIDKTGLRNVVNNIFFHVEPRHAGYPLRNFTTLVVIEWLMVIGSDWLTKYGDRVIGVETLVEKPRTGELYRRAGFTLIGETKGYTCKRVAGQGTDSWTGKRVWNTTDLRPKLVFARKL